MQNLKTRIRLLAVAASLLASVGFAATASAALIFDRGLPTANLNNAAGANRSNVAWADTGTTSIMGDNFALVGSTYVDEIRVWVATRDGLPPATAYSLYLGADAGLATVVALVAASSSVTSITYSDATTYQAGNGDFINLFEVVFSGLGLQLAPGTYAFGIDGPAAIGLNTPFVHASNALLSGSPQMGADGLIYGFTAAGLFDAANGYPFDSNGNGWDKSSDLNVQVFGSVPEPSPVALIGVALLSLLGLGLMRRRQNA